ncbi:MAG: beta-lactamase, partial [Acidimicrobiales bacterium]|nr:beta-lactamase [Acidimicrobiales bacterium]
MGAATLPDGVTGEVAEGFEPVATALGAVVAGQGGGGAQLAARHRGRWVLDLAAGTVDRSSLIHTWSAVKPVVGAALLALVERGPVSLDTAVVDLWPELAAGADGRLLVRHVLAHGAGLARIPAPGTFDLLLDAEATEAGLAAAEPDWAPGAAVGEHAFTYGHLVGGLVRRIDGRSIGRFLADEITGPLGLDLHVGVGDGDLARCADLGLPDAWWAERVASDGGAGVIPRGDVAVVNSEAWRRGEVAAVNGHASARGLAGFWAAALDGALPVGVDQAEATGLDRVLGEVVTWTRAGGLVEERLGSTEVGM